MKSRTLFVLVLCLSLLFINACRTISVTYKPNEWQQGFTMDIPPFKRIGYINGENDWIYVFLYDDVPNRQGKYLFITLPYGTTSAYTHLLNDLIEKQYGESLFDYEACGDGSIYKHLKKEHSPKYSWCYTSKNGEIKTFTRAGNSNNLFYEKQFYEKVGLHSDIYNIDTSSIKSLYVQDTIIYEGIDSSLAWKSVEIVGKIHVGYVNVPLREKRKFDRYLSTIRTIDSISLETDDFVKQFLNIE